MKLKDCKGLTDYAKTKGTNKANTDYFKPFTKEVRNWKHKHDMAWLMLEFKDLLNAVYKKGLRNGQRRNVPINRR